jgi:hypothetical protein
MGYDAEFSDDAGRRYTARSCGRVRPDGLWEGWLEFVPADGSAVVRTGRETTQPTRDTLLYWATGLSAGYLDGALLRATKATHPLPVRTVGATPAYEGPAEDTRHAAATSPAPPTAVLDPFAVYAEGDDVLRGQLGALSPAQLRNIIRAYSLSDLSVEELEALDAPRLAALIMDGVRPTNLPP